jgi:D-3-phosphoglycerate dehydrogenase
MLNRSRGDIAVTLLDLDKAPPKDVVAQLSSIAGVLSVRCLGCGSGH